MKLRTIARLTASIVVLTAAGVAGFVWSGIYDVSASDQHTALVFRLLKKVKHYSVARHSADVRVPELGAPEQLTRGVALYREHCVGCHGAPGVAPDAFALAMRPLPTPLARSGRDMSLAAIYWTVKHGIKMTGMPAFEFRMDEADVWAVVAFVRQMPSLKPVQYQELVASPVAPHIEENVAASAARGRAAVDQYACIACHMIPGMVGPEAALGPTLHGIGSRTIIAGVLASSRDNLALWIQSPQTVKPGTAMPDLYVTQRDAIDMAAFLQTLK
jgi:mono/diheme cytochrome c family protein